MILREPPNSSVETNGACPYLPGALSAGVYQESYYPLIYLIGFLCQLHLDIEDYRKASAYLDWGYQMLDKTDPDYWRDKASFDKLKEVLDGEGWQESSDGH